MFYGEPAEVKDDEKKRKSRTTGNLLGLGIGGGVGAKKLFDRYNARNQRGD